MSDKSALFPKRAKEVPDQVEIHYDVLHRHAREFVEHADWITAVHQRVTKLETADPSVQLQEFRTQFRVAMGKVQAVMWTFGVLWTVLVTVAGIVVTVVLSK
jgi:hypothetical protein